MSTEATPVTHADLADIGPLWEMTHEDPVQWCRDHGLDPETIASPVVYSGDRVYVCRYLTDPDGRRYVVPGAGGGVAAHEILSFEYALQKV